MARRKKEDSSEYDIKIGFIHEFTVHDERYSEKMNGHPMEGRVYRLIKDPQGYRLHIGRENNDAHLDGIYLGQELEGEQKAFQYRIELITKENYLNLPIVQEDTEQIVQWISTDNQDLWEGIDGERAGAVKVVRTQEDLLELLRRTNEIRRGNEEAMIVPHVRKKHSRESRATALETALNVIIQFKSKPPQDLLELFDGLYDRILTITKD